MPEALPIACTLNAADFADRRGLIAALARDALVAAEQHGPRAVLRFAAGDRVRERVESFVVGESSCCAFLTMRVAEVGDEVVLRIAAPDDADLVLAEMVAAFADARRAAA